ncbi:MAG: helix-turn-helix domain-containing protein [Saprospiraceae bacterium]|nr:helix-turn-helix domain-containing protein [Saprospiraceae bacterium]
METPSTHTPLVAEFETEAQFRSYLPNQSLQKYIVNYWYLNLHRDAMHVKPELEQPSLAFELILKFGTDYEEFLPSLGHHRVQRKSTLTGLRSFCKASKRIDTSRRLLLVGVRFSPLGMHLLSGLPLMKLSDQTVQIEDLGINVLCDVEKNINPIADPSQVITKMDIAFQKHFSTRSLSHEAEHFHAAFAATVPFSRPSFASLGFSAKTLDRRFKKYIGTTPKQYEKLRRYISFYYRWLAKGMTSYGDLIDHQYYDQNHLIKEFKSIMGKAPTHLGAHIDQQYTQSISRSQLHNLSLFY